MLNIAIIGYGKMGKRLEALAPDFDLNPTLILDDHNNKNGEGITTEAFEKMDAAIDFSHPEAFTTNLHKVLETQTPLVVGTTGWIDAISFPKMNELCSKHETPVLYGSNFSLGVQLFGKLVKAAGKLFGENELFDAVLHETHHTEKADAPSGTAQTLAELWQEGAQSESASQYGIPPEGKVDENVFRITSQRLGSVFGEHQLRINSQFDDIELTHRARSRDAFAAGALKASKWLIHQEPDFYLIEDVVEQIS